MGRILPLLTSALLLPLLAGCTGVPDLPVPPVDGGIPSDLLQPFVLDNNATGCFEAIAVLLADFAPLQALLPENYTAADAQVLLGTPAATGRGVLWLSGYTCANATLAGGAAGAGEVGVLVQAPTVANASVAEADFHIYEAIKYTNATSIQQALAATGFLHANGTTRAAPFSGPVAGTANMGYVEVEDADGIVFRYEYLAPDAVIETMSANFWHQAENGTAVFHYQLTERTINRGSVTFGCELREGTIPAQAMDGVPCGPANGVAIVVPDQAWESTFSWFPGARAVAA